MQFFKHLDNTSTTTKNGQTNFYLGLIYLGKTEHSKVKKHFDLVNNYPSSIDYFQQLASFFSAINLINQHKYTAAIKNLEQALPLKNPFVLQNLALVHEEKNNKIAANKYWKLLSKTYKDDKLILNEIYKKLADNYIELE